MFSLGHDFSCPQIWKIGNKRRNESKEHSVCKYLVWVPAPPLQVIVREQNPCALAMSLAHCWMLSDLHLIKSHLSWNDAPLSRWENRFKEIKLYPSLQPRTPDLKPCISILAVLSRLPALHLGSREASETLGEIMWLEWSCRLLWIFTSTLSLAHFLYILLLLCSFAWMLTLFLLLSFL